MRRMPLDMCKGPSLSAHDEQAEQDQLPGADISGVGPKSRG